jgi:NADH-quinone oxidoreductase subunit L
VVTLPLVLLAIPSVIIGAIAIGRCCSATSSRASIHVIFIENHPAMAEMAEEFHGWVAWRARLTSAVLAGLAGVVVSWFFYMKRRTSRRRSSAFLRSTSCWTTSTTWTGSTRHLRPRRALLGTGLWKGGDQA